LLSCTNAHQHSAYYPLTFSKTSKTASSETLVNETVDSVKAQSSLSAVLAAYYSGKQQSSAFNDLKSRCTARITATLAKLRERAQDFENQLNNSGNHSVLHFTMQYMQLVHVSKRVVQGQLS
jgi:hypothetical protein